MAHGTLVKSGIFLIPNIIEFDTDTSHGAAGAPIINTATGELIGVNTHEGCQAGASISTTNSGTSVWGNRDFKKAVKTCISKEDDVIAVRDLLLRKSPVIFDASFSKKSAGTF